MSVYFARVRGYVKIGYSAKPWKRVDTLTVDKTTRPADIERHDPIDFFGWFPGDHAAERAAHMTLGAYHVCGEWFWDEPEVEAYFHAQDQVVDAHSISFGAFILATRGVPVSEAILADQLWRESLPPVPPEWDWSEGLARTRAINQAERAAERESYRSQRKGAAA